MIETEKKDPRIAALASFFIPGLGQVYDGEGLLIGIMWLLGALIGLLFMILPGLVVWLYGIYNAYSVAEKMNAGMLPFKATNSTNMVILAIIAVFLYIVFLAIVALSIAAIIAAVYYGTSNIH